MIFKVLNLLIYTHLLSLAVSDDTGFTFNGFRGSNLSLDGSAIVTPDGLLKLTNTSKGNTGHAFFYHPFYLTGKPGKVSSFSTTFAFAIATEYPGFATQGMAFFLSPRRDFYDGSSPNQYLGLFNQTNNGNSSNHIVAVELDTIQNLELGDIDDNHVGIDINGLRSTNSSTAGYFTSGGFRNLTLVSGDPMFVWVDYDGMEMQLNVSLYPLEESKPARPLLSCNINLSDVISDPMYVGFSSSTGSSQTIHYVLGWSFEINGKAQALDLSALPSLPSRNQNSKPSALAVWLPVAGSVALLVIIAGIIYAVIRKIKYAELLEDWEVEYGPHRFSFKDLYKATKGFKDRELLGAGGFGQVYKGVLPRSRIEVAVKRVSHNSKQGLREFIAEIVSIGRLRHRNVVQLLGYCRRKGELILVYDFMPNSSLDKMLFDQDTSILDWSRRFRIIKGVASGLLYLHEEWEQVVIHRDVKASNVLLDSELNGKLGDFGLARLYDHGTDPQTTHVVGTMGYLAPELSRTGKATTATDMFAFGAFLLEVACGRRPIQPRAPREEVILVDWVQENRRREAILESADPKLGGMYSVEEMELVLKLGLLCSHPSPLARPCMRQVIQFLKGDAPFPESSSTYPNSSMLALLQYEGLGDYFMSLRSSSSVMESILSGGR